MGANSFQARLEAAAAGCFEWVIGIGLDPVTAHMEVLDLLGDLEFDFESVQVDVIHRARALGATWTQIGSYMEVSTEEARELYYKHRGDFLVDDIYCLLQRLGGDSNG